jgi:polyisoprenoid-binding protein YceI
LDVTWIDAGNYPFGDRHYAIGISARGSILRSEWGMTYGVADGLVGDEIEIIIEAELIRED